MKTEQVQYFSEGQKVAGLWRTPDDPQGPVPAIIQGPGWYGYKDAKDYLPYHEAFTAAGYGVLVIDYRGFGDSDGERGHLSGTGQLADLVNGVTFLTTREDVEGEAIGAFGTGGTGGGNVVALAGVDPRVRVGVSQFPVADGESWLRRMRTETDWVAYKRLLEQDRKDRVLTGEGRMVHPREEIMVQTPERKKSDFKKDVDGNNPALVPLSIADEVLRYRPVDLARGLATPLMVIGVEDDDLTPFDHAQMIYDAAVGPKRLLTQRGTTHYAAYRDYGPQVIPQIVAWFRAYLHGPGSIPVVSANVDA